MLAAAVPVLKIHLGGQYLIQYEWTCSKIAILVTQCIIVINCTYSSSSLLCLCLLCP